MLTTIDQARLEASKEMLRFNCAWKEISASYHVEASTDYIVLILQECHPTPTGRIHPFLFYAKGESLILLPQIGLGANDTW